MYRRHKRIELRIKEYENEDKLSKHGMWSKGYWIGKRAELEETIDFIDEILDIYNKRENQNFKNTFYTSYSVQNEIKIRTQLDKLEI